jgi:hypothetical protein
MLPLDIEHQAEPDWIETPFLQAPEVHDLLWLAVLG